MTFPTGRLDPIFVTYHKTPQLHVLEIIITIIYTCIYIYTYTIRWNDHYENRCIQRWRAAISFTVSHHTPTKSFEVDTEYRIE
jgi:hypothetical protein